MFYCVASAAHFLFFDNDLLSEEYVMALFKCKMCGGDLNIVDGATVCECEYCGTKQTLPKLDDEKKSNLYDRANHFRRNNEYDKAMSIYEKILEEDKTDAEAYWSIVLCEYGIEYVEDPSTHKRVPTVNRTQFTSILADENYKQALKYADGYQKDIYESEAKAIDEIQKGILEISNKEEPFDVFICYKETDENGRRTRDSVIATELYHELTNEGFKVFFSRITLEDKLGEEYEPYIFAALNSAKAMVVLGSKAEYFNAPWVKNEWARYLSLISKGEKKILIPAYKDIDPYDLPEEFSHLQAQDMSKLGFMQDLIRGIKKILDDNNETPPKTVVINNSVGEVAPLLKRAFMFLEDKNWASADEYAEKVLDIDPENAEAYLVKLMAELKVAKREELSNLEQPFDDNNNYKKALRFGDMSLKKELLACIEAINTRNENERIEGVYTQAYALMENTYSRNKLEEAKALFESIKDYKDSSDNILKCEELIKEAIYKEATHLVSETNISDNEKAIELFEQILDYKDSSDNILKCEELIEELIKEAIYKGAKDLISEINITNNEEAIELFEQIPDYKDSQEMIAECKENIAKIQQRQEEQRLKEAKADKRDKVIVDVFITTLCLAILAIIIFFVINKLIIPTNNYNSAVELMNDKQYNKAISIVYRA